LLPNINTDAIIPSREMVAPTKSGYGERLFAAWRYLSADVEVRIENPEFILNQPRYRAARILLAGENFGCGSSREPAVWAIHQFGMRCVIAPSFGTIFQRNCVANGVLPVVLSRQIVDQLAAHAHQHVVTVDLVSCSVVIGDLHAYAFLIEDAMRQQLLHGIDPIADTRAYQHDVDKFEQRDRTHRPWVWPVDGSTRH
jgi:3-isopropylmalate/(R)-2-methylmalate dehydratase small subunit